MGIFNLITIRMKKRIRQTRIMERVSIVLSESFSQRPPADSKTPRKRGSLEEIGAQRWLEGERYRYYKFASNNLDAKKTADYKRVKRRDALYRARRAK